MPNWKVVDTRKSEVLTSPLKQGQFSDIFNVISRYDICVFTQIKISMRIVVTGRIHIVTNSRVTIEYM